MSRMILALGAAALAVSAPAYSDPGGKGGSPGKGQGGGQAMKADRGHDGGGHGGGANAIRQLNDGGHGRDQAKGGAVVASGEGRGKDRHKFAHDQHNDKQAHVAIRNSIRGDRDDQVRIVTRDFDNDFSRGRGLANGCPPGLDRKDNGCLPPGQVDKLLGARLQNSFASSLIPYQYRSWYRDDDDHFYRSGDGFIYRVSRDANVIDGIIPLFGGGSYYARGDQWPDPYNFYNVPQQYRGLYSDNGGYNYRYGDGAIYRVNSGSGVVDSIVALLAGDLGVGSRLPTGYDAYNVPLSYRDRYYDTADNWYRYNDGYIYQVDPKTRLISAVINAII